MNSARRGKTAVWASFYSLAPFKYPVTYCMLCPMLCSQKRTMFLPFCLLEFILRLRTHQSKQVSCKAMGSSNLGWLLCIQYLFETWER